MFDIREYCLQDWDSPFGESSGNINEELSADIENLLVSAGGTMYLCDKYKNSGVSIDLIYPVHQHPDLYSYMPSPDRMRFVLSLYPYRSDLSRVHKIVVRPRYIEAGDIELAALYVKENRTIVLYLSHPFSHGENMDGSRKFVSASLDKISGSKIIGDSIESSNGDRAKVPVLWNIISVVDPEGDGEMEKFFLKRDHARTRDYSILTDLSYYYKRLGY